MLTLITIHMVPEVVEIIGWEWAFWTVAIGPLLGFIAMGRLRRLPDAVKIAGGRR